MNKRDAYATLHELYLKYGPDQLRLMVEVVITRQGPENELKVYRSSFPGKKRRPKLGR
jgi:hypothetical protein